MRVFFNGVTDVERTFCFDIAHVRTLSERDTVHYIIRFIINQFELDMFLVASHYFTRSIIIDVIAPLFPVYQGDRLLSAICCGVLSGLGYAMIYMRDSSTGGSDFIMMSIKALNPHLSLGNIAFALDAVIVILGTVIVSHDVDSLIYGLIVSYLLSLVMDKVMYGIDEGKLALIVTDPEHSTEICFKIDEVLGRGSTILNGMGSYSKDDKHIVMCACNNKQMYGIRKLIKTIDPKSFLVIMESNDVVGEGFKDE